MVAGSLFLLAAISMVSLAGGSWALRVRQANVLAVSLSFLAGYGAWGMLVFFTGLVSGLYTFVLAAELAVLGFLFRRRLNEVLSIAGELFARLRNAPLALRLVVGSVGAYLVFLLLVSFGPVTSWDALESHWPLAKFFARHHGVPFPYFNGNGGTPQLMRMHFTVFSVFGFDHQASHTVWVMVPALLGLGFGVARRFSSSTAALALTLAAFGVLVVQPQLTLQPTLDLPPMIFGLGAVVAAVAPALFARRENSQGGELPLPLSRFFVVSGLLAGYALGTKWHIMALYPVLLVCFLLFWRRDLPAKRRGINLTWWIVGAFLPFVTFAVYDLAHTGHPFWHPLIPVFWNTDYWSAVAANVNLCLQNVELYRARLCPTPRHDVWGSLRWIYRNHALILPALFFVLFALREIRSERGTMIGTLLGGGVFCFLVPTFLLYPHFRHTMLGVAILLLLVPLGWDSLCRWKYRWLVLALPVLVILGVASKFASGRHPQVFDSYVPALTSVVRGPYYDENYQARYGIPATRWANVHLPGEAMIIADQRCLGNLDRDWMTIFPATQFRIGLTADLSADSLYRLLVDIGATHLWVDRVRYWDMPEHFPALSSMMTSWEQLLDRDDLLEPVYTDSLTSIFRLRPD